MLSNSSKFSWLALGAPEHSRPQHDRVLYETDNFAVLPSLGSIVPNWVLIVPKRPMSNLRALTVLEFSELEGVLDHVIDVLGLRRKKTYFFEHGGKTGSTVSCGVDQAHLHLVELPFDLMSSAKATDKPMQWVERCAAFANLGVFLPEEEYLVVGQAETFMVAIPTERTSQWFRKVIAKNIGQNDAWDYKVNPKYLEVWKTEERFRSNCLKTNNMN